MRFLCNVSPVKFLRFCLNDCLQHCKLSILLAEVGGFLPALFILRSLSGRRGFVLTVYGLVPFIVSFHDLRLLRNEGVAQYAEHLIVINAVFAIVPFVPRLKIPSGAEVHQFGILLPHHASCTDPATTCTDDALDEIRNLSFVAELVSRSRRHGSHPFRGRFFRQQQIHKGVCRLCVIAVEVRRYA